MTSPTRVSEAEHGVDEEPPPPNPRDGHIEHLWHMLEPSKTGELDFKGLKKGFRKIDHPMKNADEMLKRIMREVDLNGDGKIQFEEFRTFVQRADRQLYDLFESMDKDGNGKLDVKELQSAFKRAGLSVSNRRLGCFFDDMDSDNDGYVTFEEWRDFLLFMPAREHDTQLHAVLSFYYSVVNVTPEGDSLVSEETLEGLGTTGFSRSLLQSVFGSLYRLTSPPGGPATQQLEPFQRPLAVGSSHAELDVSPRPNSSMEPVEAVPPSTSAFAAAAAGEQMESMAGVGPESVSNSSHHEPVATRPGKTIKKFSLTDFIPDPGYFLAGAAAGGVSRTATAPLDRLKVYLLVNTTVRSAELGAAGTAVKQIKPVSALRRVTKPITDAVRDIYRSGGFRGFFAGNGLNVAKIMPETAIKFGSYEAAKRAFANLEGHDDPRKISSYSKFTAGGCAGMIAQFFVYPLDTLKFRLQCETVKDGLTGSALVRQTAMKMYADGGLRSCYRGVTMGLIGMFPYSAIDMGMFELLKKTYRTTWAKYTGCHEDDANPGNIATGLIGASSGAFGASVVYPLNVVRTRLQTQGTVMHKATYTGIWDVTQKTIQKEGWRGLYKGLTPNLLKVAPALSITWVVYENSKKALGLS